MTGLCIPKNPLFFQATLSKNPIIIHPSHHLFALQHSESERKPMEPTINIDQWMDEFSLKLKGVFGDRLLLVGIQGSRARNEARPGSDIDAVVVIDGLSPEDLKLYESIVGSMSLSELACGFIGSADVLAAWPRYDAFNLVKDTHIHFGSFDFMDTLFTAEDALNSAKAVAAEVYHALVHTVVFDDQNLGSILDACIKPAFFAMRALRFANLGTFPATRAEMRELATENETLFLDAYDGKVNMDTPEAIEKLADRLIAWAADIITLDATDHVLP